MEQRRRKVSEDLGKPKEHPTDCECEDLSQAAEEVEAGAELDYALRVPISVEHMISTGCTLLDLAISGKRKRGSGIPGGILLEIYGKPGSGKTAVLVETCASAQARGGEVEFIDPEARLDREYSNTYGMTLAKDNYYQVDTVEEMFDIVGRSRSIDPGKIHVTAADSLAALSTKLEMDGEDKMGMRRAKMFSERLRKTARLLAQQNRILFCSNQVRQGEVSMITPGGNAIPFYASCRIQINQDSKLEKEKAFSYEGVTGKTIKKVIGIESTFTVVKNSIDDPFRSGRLFIVFGVGIDDVRTNLQYVKDMLKLSTYWTPKGTYQQMDAAIAAIERDNLEDELREQVINIWEAAELAFAKSRKPKRRW